MSDRLDLYSTIVACQRTVGSSSFIQKVNELDPTVRWQATIVEYKSKRSDIQNNRYWSLMTEFGNFEYLSV